jgi:hypothetical protein
MEEERERRSNRELPTTILDLDSCLSEKKVIVGQLESAMQEEKSQEERGGKGT